MKQKNNPIAKFFVKMLGNEKYQFITIPVFSIIVSLLVGAVVILALGKNPVEAYGNLLQGSGLLMKEKYAGGKSILTDFLSFVDYWTPMIFAALAVAVALKPDCLISEFPARCWQQVLWHPLPLDIALWQHRLPNHW